MTTPRREATRVKKSSRALSFRGVLRLSEPKLCSLIRPTGYYREKARRLRLLAKIRAAIALQPPR
ncbi:MAG TPA: hypothetical protein EYP11_06120 [Aquificaceae bacterium]|nr:hypothetical protein [Aquificaceae bacterium]